MTEGGQRPRLPLGEIRNIAQQGAAALLMTCTGGADRQGLGRLAAPQSAVRVRGLGVARVPLFGLDHRQCDGRLAEESLGSDGC